MHAHPLAISAVASLAMTGGARADWAIHTVPLAPADGRLVVTFLSSDAGYTGELRFIDPFTLAPSEVIFNNHTTAPGTQVDVASVLQDDALNFQYEVLTGQPAVFSMANGEGLQQFWHEPIDSMAWRFGIEDIRFSISDHDYNDAVFEARIVPVPAPGVLALSVLGGLIAAHRRR
ncbi:MAG: DUF4114 domain-containing protein [Phycisphaeraceae bacterium]|nr:DUF4114 domain-containing protein [Phycisphaeraceae bacterium]